MCIRDSHGDALVYLHPEALLPDIAFRQIRVDVQLHPGIQLGDLLLALGLPHRLLDQLDVHVVAHGAQVAALLLSLIHIWIVFNFGLRVCPLGRTSLPIFPEMFGKTPFKEKQYI